MIAELRAPVCLPVGQTLVYPGAYAGIHPGFKVTRWRFQWRERTLMAADGNATTTIIGGLIGLSGILATATTTLWYNLRKSRSEEKTADASLETARAASVTADANHDALLSKTVLESFQQYKDVLIELGKVTGELGKLQGRVGVLEGQLATMTTTNEGLNIDLRECKKELLLVRTENDGLKLEKADLIAERNEALRARDAAMLMVSGISQEREMDLGIGSVAQDALQRSENRDRDRKKGGTT
jgi:hypothetical protein